MKLSRSASQDEVPRQLADATKCCWSALSGRDLQPDPAFMEKGRNLSNVVQLQIALVLSRASLYDKGQDHNLLEMW